jgi:Zinc finger, C3HC4 type (RING finger)
LERHLFHLLSMAVFFVVLALTFMEVCNSMSLAWYFGAMLMYEIGRDILKWAIIKESTPQYEVFRSILKYVRLAVWASFIYFYALFLSEKPNSRTALTATIPGVLLSSFELIIDLFVNIGSSIEKITFIISKVWRIMLWITLTILFSGATIETSTGEIVPDCDKYAYIVWSFVVLTFFICQAIYFLVKTIETSVTISRKEQLNGIFMLRMSRYLCFHFWIVLLSFALCNYLVQQKLFVIKSTGKAILCWVAASGYCLLIGLAIAWRAEIKKLGELDWTEFNQLYPNCLTKRISNQVHQARLARISQSQIDAGNHDASVLAPVLNGIEHQNSVDRRSSPIVRRPLVSLQPQRVERSQNNQNLDPIPIANENPENQSIGSIRFIERKSSVVFSHITAKKIQGLLQVDGLLEEKKPQLTRKVDKKWIVNNKQRPKSASKVEEETASLPEPKRQKSHSKVLAHGEAQDPSELQLDVNASPPNDQMSREEVKNTLILDNKFEDIPIKSIVMGREKPPKIMRETIYEKLKAVLREEFTGVPNPPILQKSKITKCLICEVNPSNCIIYPCYHSKVCLDCCVQMLDWRHSKCHFCRGHLEKIIVIDASTSYNNIFKVIQVYTINYQDDEPDPNESESSVQRAVEAIQALEGNNGNEELHPPVFNESESGASSFLESLPTSRLDEQFA